MRVIQMQKQLLDNDDVVNCDTAAKYKWLFIIVILHYS